MKGELEDAVKGLGFKHVVIARPGLLLGEREKGRLGEGQMQTFTKGMRSLLGHGITDKFAQDSSMVARAAVRAGLACARKEREEGVWMLEQADIVKLGAAEWRGTEEGKL
jgi:uncharacterized protein YbjT (DUF2867 family)